MINAESRILLGAPNATSAGLLPHPECKTLTGILTRSSKTVTGHLYMSADRMLMYIVVLDYTVVAP